MKIGLFGGSFDPPHFGHLQIADAAKKYFNLDEVWFIPVFISPFKTDNPPECAEHRLNMVKLLIEGSLEFKALDIEILKKRPSFTIDTLEQLVEQHPDYEFYLLLGQDALDHFLSWKNPEDIVKMVKLAIAPRKPEIDLSFLKNNPKIYAAALNGILPMPVIPISSTMIRRAASKRAGLDEFVPKNIAEYIQSHHLYLDD